VGSGVSLPSLARALEAIRRLVAIGALDGALIGGIGSLGGGPSIALPELQRPTSLSVQGPGGSATAPAPGGKQHVTDILRPGGKLIGDPGTSSKIRILHGGKAEAEALFGRLTQGGEAITGTTYPGKLVRLTDGGKIGFRPTSTSGPPTIDVFIEGLGIREIKFIP